jgi:hypothetical protein
MNFGSKENAMTLRTQRLILFVVALASFSLGGVSGRYYPQIKAYVTTQPNRADDSRWPEGFSVVRIRSSADGTCIHPISFLHRRALPGPCW